ncbi:MAG: amino acid adenylation domain-containing protein [Clostridia bacterium]|nr:amino acid adenylation domain-containing protein [Clostridia bacterium]
MLENLYDLTNPQKSIWLTEQFYKGTSIENITGSVTILQKVDFNALKNAINLFIKKNDSFRLKFVLKNDKIMQYVDNFAEFDIETIMVSSEQNVKKLEKQMCDTLFNVLDSVLFKFKLFKFNNGNGGFIITAHHLVADAWTAGLLVNEIMEYYELLTNNNQVLNEKNLSYVEYINSEQDYLNSEKFKKDKLFWNDTFKCAPEIATIPSVKENLSQKTDCSSSRNEFIIPKETISLINSFCKSQKASIFNFFMAVFAIYISRTSNLDEFVIGTPVLNRGNFKEKQTTGMYINTIPFKISLPSDNSFGQFLSNISVDFLKIFRHQKYPYQYLLEDLRTADNAIPNLYKILLSYQNVRSNKQTSNILYESRWVENSNISDDIDIHLYDMNDTGNLNIAYDYRTCKYSDDDICSIHARILHIVNQILENNEINLKDIEIVTLEEKHKILYEFNNTKVDYQKDKTISQLFEEQVEKTPNNIALVFENQKLTYKELNEKANSLANYLRNKGICRNDIVGIMVNRSLEMIIGIIAVLKSGGCYIPIDPEYPQDRIEYMLQNSEAKMLLTFEKLENKVDFNNKIFIELSNNIYNENYNNLENINNPEDLAYVIYTSGSTGLPKGVMLKHKALSNLTHYCNNYVSYLKNNKYRNIVSVTTISFDIFIFETLISLQKGLKLIIANENEQTIPRLLNNLIEKEKIEIVQMTPSRMQLLVNSAIDIPNLQKINFITLAGEQLPLSLVQKLKLINKNVIIYNGYGPSETTVFSTFTDVTKCSEITIGRPLNNTQIYILDSNKSLCPINIPGEIYISGDGVGLGYINNSDLTNKSFINNLFIENTIMYKTGDLAFYKNTGEIVCLGRTDSQIKIRGLRIELEEIENKILEVSNIRSCVVTKKSNLEGHEFLCAYFIKNGIININNIRNLLKSKLPTYMIPQYFVELEKLPYTPNGKIDKNKLPMPKETLNKEIVLPRNDMDSDIIEILKDLLHISSVSIEDSFFELGGDSLSAINLSTKIYNKFNAQIFVKDILENPIIRDLSDLISSRNEVENSNIITKAKKSEYYPTSAAQKRVYYASLVDGEDSVLYNLTGGLFLNKVPNITKLENCFNFLIQRHESLRTSFDIVNNEVVQQVQEVANYKLDVEQGLLKDKQELFYSFSQPFDLSKAPLFRTKLIKFENNCALLLVDMHHIISDRYFFVDFNK